MPNSAILPLTNNRTKLDANDLKRTTFAGYPQTTYNSKTPKVSRAYPPHSPWSKLQQLLHF